MYKDIDERMAKLFNLVVNINERTVLAGFFNISGHVGKLNIYIRPDKENVLDSVYEENFYYIGDLKDSNEKFDKAITDLEKILQEAELK